MFKYFLYHFNRQELLKVAAVAQRQSTCLTIKRLRVQIQPEARLFPFLSNVFLNMSPAELHLYPNMPQNSVTMLRDAKQAKLLRISSKKNSYIFCILNISGNEMRAMVAAEVDLNSPPHLNIVERQLLSLLR